MVARRALVFGAAFCEATLALERVALGLLLSVGAFLFLPTIPGVGQDPELGCIAQGSVNFGL